MMDLRTFKFEDQALEIATSKSRFWEYLLYRELMNDELQYVKLALVETSLIRQGVELKFKMIKNNGDLQNLLDVFITRFENITKMAADFRTLLPKYHSDAFGPPGIPGYAPAIMILARKVANLYYDVGLILNEVTIEMELFDHFFDKNMDISIEMDRLIRTAMIKSNQLIILFTRNTLTYIEEFGSYLQSKIESEISGTAFNRIHAFDSPDDKEALDALEAVQVFLEAHSLAQRANSKAQKVLSNQHESEIKRFASTREVVRWLSDKSIVTLAEMRNILLPLDLFPGAFIEDINERALDAVGEMALSEDGQNIEIDQKILQEVDANWKD